MTRASAGLVAKVQELIALPLTMQDQAMTRLRARATSAGEGPALERELVEAGLTPKEPGGNAREQSRVSAMPSVAVRGLTSIASATGLDGAAGGMLYAERTDAAPLDTGLALASLSAASGITVQAASKMASSPYLWHIVTALVSKTRERELAGQGALSHVHEISGGADGLRKFCGIHSKNADVDVWEMLRTLQELRISNTDNAASMLSAFRRTRATAGKPSTYYVIEVGLLLRPAMAKRLGLADHFDIPILPPSMVPLTGYSSTRGRQINAVELLMIYTHDQRRDIHREGSFKLTSGEWDQIAGKAGLYERQHASARRALFTKLQEPPACPLLPFERVATTPLLVSVGPDRYAFGESFLPEWKHFREQGAISEHQSAKGLRGVDKRASERAKRSPKAA